LRTLLASPASDVNCVKKVRTSVACVALDGNNAGLKPTRLAA